MIGTFCGTVTEGLEAKKYFVLGFGHFPPPFGLGLKAWLFSCVCRSPARPSPKICADDPPPFPLWHVMCRRCITYPSPQLIGSQCAFHSNLVHTHTHPHTLVFTFLQFCSQCSKIGLLASEMVHATICHYDKLANRVFQQFLNPNETASPGFMWSLWNFLRSRLCGILDFIFVGGSWWQTICLFQCRLFKKK